MAIEIDYHLDGEVVFLISGTAHSNCHRRDLPGNAAVTARCLGQEYHTPRPPLGINSDLDLAACFGRMIVDVMSCLRFQGIRCELENLAAAGVGWQRTMTRMTPLKEMALPRHSAHGHTIVVVFGSFATVSMDKG